MRVLIVGGGGREHALAWACSRAGSRPELLCAPGNGGTASIAENVAVAPTDALGLARLVRERRVDLVVIGPDAALAAGVADACSREGAAVFGPGAAAARIESSKVFAKTLMEAAGIPTARWWAGGRPQREALIARVGELGGRCVVKADGLALGKGVLICDSATEAAAALAQCFDERRFGDAADEVIIEERLEGREVTVLALCDGRAARLLPPAVDYKRAFDGNHGPNTGGMGAMSPPRDVDGAWLLGEAERRVILPCLDALRQRGLPFRGCLYAGLMIGADGLRVLEFNARFGDPEAQVVLPLLEEDIVELLLSCAGAEVGPGRVRARGAAAVGVVATSAGYPGPSETGVTVSGLERLDEDVLCFHGGTARRGDGAIVTTGGRVLTVVATGADLDAARVRAYDNVERVDFPGGRCRRDIGAPPLGVGA